MAGEGAEDRRERGRAWLMLAAGTAAAGLEAWTVCSRLRPSAKQSWVGAIFWSGLSTAICVSGGVVTAWVAAQALRVRRGAGALIGNAAVGWAFLPCILLMVVRGSWLALPVTALAAAAAAFRLHPLLRRDSGSEGRAGAAGGSWPSLYGLPPMGAPPLRWFGVAVCAQACVALAANGRLGLASAALAASLAMLIAWGTAWDGSWGRFWAGRRRAGQLFGAAVLLTLLLTPWVSGGNGLGVAAAGARAPAKANAAHEAERYHTGSDYIGIILWPPPVKKVQIVAPQPSSSSFGQGVAAKPLVIPFDGPYWYFKAPYTEPGPKAHVAFGKPTEETPRSTDWMPLRMEAHQNLGLPIELNCCREIDVTVTNADLGVGTIVVSLTLTDSSGMPGRGPGRALSRSLILGAEPVVSSEPTEAQAGREPVTETLKFAVPRTATIQRFDKIDVAIQPTMQRARMGARVAVDEFELVPR